MKALIRIKLIIFIMIITGTASLYGCSYSNFNSKLDEINKEWENKGKKVNENKDAFKINPYTDDLGTLESKAKKQDEVMGDWWGATKDFGSLFGK